MERFQCGFAGGVGTVPRQRAWGSPVVARRGILAWAAGLVVLLPHRAKVSEKFAIVGEIRRPRASSGRFLQPTALCTPHLHS